MYAITQTLHCTSLSVQWKHTKLYAGKIENKLILRPESDSLNFVNGMKSCHSRQNWHLVL